jgi:hypothetical protein
MHVSCCLVRSDKHIGSSLENCEQVLQVTNLSKPGNFYSILKFFSELGSNEPCWKAWQSSIKCLSFYFSCQRVLKIQRYFFLFRHLIELIC